jgi:DNA-binding NarL/FixJ family response regulator
MAQNPSTQEGSVDIFILPANQIRGLAPETLSQAFYDGTSRLLGQALELGLVDEGESPLSSALDTIDERLHGGEDVPDADLSKKLDVIFHLTDLPVVRKHIPYEEIEVTISDKAVEYHEPEEPSTDSAKLWQEFLAERAAKKAQEEAERAARPLRRKQTFERKAQVRAEEAARRGKLHEAAIRRRNKSLDRKRQRKLEGLREEWASHSPEIAECLTPLQQEVLPVLHLPGEDAATLLGINRTALQQRVHHIKNKAAVETRAGLAIWALERGVNYDVALPPPMEEFSLRERVVASHLDKQNPDIMREQGFSSREVRSDVMSLLQKTGAKNRTELALIARIYGFEPLPEELAADQPPDVLKPFTKFQRPVLSRLHQPYKIIAGELGIAEYSVQGAVRRALEIADIPNSVALALKLLEEGLTFDIHDPGRPLHELLTEQELGIAQSLELPFQEIADKYGLTEARVNALVGYIKTKTGARTRTELALIARIFDTGQAKPLYHNIRPRKERFFEALGIEPIPMEEARTLLEHVTPRQAEYLAAYYFSEKQLSWRAIAKQLFVRRETAIIAATRGVERIREHLESS